MKKVKIYGSVLDEQTRCIHYHSERDVVAIKFACCGKYYPCFYCHQHKEDHPIKRWPEEEFNEKVIFCGKCKSEISVNDYLYSNYCPRCHAEFNPGCVHHYHLYFAIM